MPRELARTQIQECTGAARAGAEGLPELGRDFWRVQLYGHAPLPVQLSRRQHIYEEDVL